MMPTPEFSPASTKFVKYVNLPATRARLYNLVSIGLILWTSIYVFVLGRTMAMTVYRISYYVANYDVGFVRRGLGGEILKLFPQAHYFTIVRLLVWVSIAVYLTALVALMWQVLFRRNRAERRVVLALLIPLLPFSVSFAVLNSRPELFAASALVAFGIALTYCDNVRAALVVSALYGSVTAVLTFVHEAIPLEFALGAVLAVLVLASGAARAVQRTCILLAVVPGLAATVVIAVLGRRDAAAQLCAQVPHGPVENPFAVPVPKFPDFILHRYESRSDYHDWVCRNIIPVFDQDMFAGLHSVVRMGFVLLLANFICGMLVFLGGVMLINYFSGARFNGFLGQVRGEFVLPLLALLLMVPLFATAIDWIRWWTIILFNIGFVYILYASDSPEIEKPVSARQVRVFLAAVIVLAMVPLGGAPGIPKKTGSTDVYLGLGPATQRCAGWPRTTQASRMTELTPRYAAELLETIKPPGPQLTIRGRTADSFGMHPNSMIKIARFADEIKAGNWAPGSVILLSASGRLMDGSHRCRAVILAGKPISVDLRIDVNGPR
jgi:hypothetical protein